MAEYAAFGTTLGMDISSSTSFTALAQIRDISGPSLAKGTAETTHRNSTGRWRTFVSTLRDGGEITFDLVFDPDDASHALMLTAFEENNGQNFRVTFPDATPATWTFLGEITAFEPSAPMEDALTASVTIKVSGAITRA